MIKSSNDKSIDAVRSAKTDLTEKLSSSSQPQEHLTDFIREQDINGLKREQIALEKELANVMNDKRDQETKNIRRKIIQQRYDNVTRRLNDMMSPNISEVDESGSKVEIDDRQAAPIQEVKEERIDYSKPLTSDSFQHAFDIGNSDKSEEIRNMLIGTTLDIPERSMSNRFNKFSRYGYLDPYSELITGTREYLFFSKPDLHIFKHSATLQLNEELNMFPFFKEVATNYPYSALSLQQYFGGRETLAGLDIGTDPAAHFNIKSKFIQILSNHVTSSLDLPGISAEEQLNNQTLWGDNISYREGSNRSDTQADFSLEFKDTKYLDVYMIFKIYDEYIRAKYITEVSPNRKEYIEQRINPEPFSIWKVIVDDTGRIMYWAKATGVVPMNVPRDTLSNIENNLKFTINFKAQFVEEMDPVHLYELNYLTQKSIGLSMNTKTDLKSKSIISYIGELTSDIVQAQKRGQYADGWHFETDTFNRVSKTHDHDKYVYVPGADTWVGYPFVINNKRVQGRTGDESKKTGSFYKLGWLSK